MSNNKEGSSYLSLLKPKKHIDYGELAFLRNRRQINRLIRQQNLTERVFKTIAIASMVATALFGIGAVSCWVLEVVNAEVVPAIENQPDWHRHKHICFGWMLITMGSFCGSVTLNPKLGEQ